MNKKYMIFLPLLLSIGSILFFWFSIQQHQRHLNQGESIYVQLAPADPRSLIQGDYMVLAYQLFFDERLDNRVKDFDDKTMTIYVQLDEQKRVIKSDIQAQQGMRPLIIKNPKGYLTQAYPSTNSFMFAEGLGECYQQAKYAEFVVDDVGKPMLKNLVGEQLNALNCEQGKTWSQGVRTVESTS